MRDPRLFGSEAYQLRASSLPNLVICPMRAFLQFQGLLDDPGNGSAEMGSLVHEMIAHWHTNGNNREAAVAAVDEDTPSRATAVAMAKAASDDCQRAVCRDSFQSFGGIGFTWEHDAHLFIKRAEANGALFGGSAEHSLAVAASLGVVPT